MKKIIMTVMFCLLMYTAAADVLISEVYYDPIGTESGGEAIELYNPTTQPIDISGYKILTPKSDTFTVDAVIGEQSVIGPKSFFLITDENFTGLRDSPGMADPDFEVSITIRNTDGGVALARPDDTLVDAVGWGNAANLAASLYEGSIASPAAKGESLQRDLTADDSDDNSIDFSSGPPNLKNSGKSRGNELLFKVVVGEDGSSGAWNLSVADEDPTTPTIDLYPLPKKKKYFNLTFVTEGSVQEVTATFRSKEYPMNQTKKNTTHTVFEIPLEFDYYTAPGTYDIDVEITDENGDTSSDNMTVNYLEMVAVELDANEFSCSSGSECIITGDKDPATSTHPTLQNIGNTKLNAEISGLNFSSKDSSFSVENLEFTFGPSFTGKGIKVTNQPLLYSLGLAAGVSSQQEISFKVNIPSSAKKGEYISRVSLVAVKDDNE